MRWCVQAAQNLYVSAYIKLHISVNVECPFVFFSWSWSI